MLVSSSMYISIAVDIYRQFKMNFLSGFFLLVLVCSVSGFLDTSGTDIYAPTNFFSSKGKELVNELQSYFDELEENFEKFMDDLKGDKMVSSALTEYKTAFQSIENTNCFAESPEVYEDLLKYFVVDCGNSLPIQEFATFYSKIDAAKGKLKEVDEEIKQNSVLCNTSPEVCKENEERLLHKLEDVLSEEEKTKLTDASREVYKSMTKKLEDCFVHKTNDLCNDIEKVIKNIKNCVNKM